MLGFHYSSSPKHSCDVSPTDSTWSTSQPSFHPDLGHSTKVLAQAKAFMGSRRCKSHRDEPIGLYLSLTEHY